MTKKRDILLSENAEDFIRIAKSVKEKLIDLKIASRESYSEVIYRLIVAYEESEE